MTTIATTSPAGAEERGGHRGRERRGADVGERDADEEGDEELVRPREERLKRCLLGTLLLGQALEAGPPEREVGRLGAREEGGDEHERDRGSASLEVASGYPLKCS